MERNDFLEVKSLKELNEKSNDYFTALLNNNFPEIEADSIPTYISLVKRPLEKQIGIYSGISLFEAINRIASDLILWYGLEYLINDVLTSKERKQIGEIKLCLGNKNITGQGDLLICVNGENQNGEVFNAAKSYFGLKLQNTLNKWEEGKLHYILCNSDGCPEDLWEKKKKLKEQLEKKNVKLIKVNLSEKMYDDKGALRIPQFES